MTAESNSQTLAVTVGRNLRVWRARNAVTQMDLARRMRMSQGYFSRVEQGQKCLSLRTLERLATEIGVPVSELTTSDGG
ncbi:helix-turn-helix domain-containing protein [Imhoffiella purpurea]|nr:helix-turn-helix transcriptional regulator [Imhoffiella purpurea]